MVELSLPFSGLWLAVNSPARKVPSHGSDVFGEAYAIDFVAVDERRRTATRLDWRSVLATEPPDRFLAFGRPLLAPADGVVVATHDGEADHVARRSPLTLTPYLLTQVNRLRQGINAIAGNHVIIELADGAGFAAMVHLRKGSLKVAAGDRVAVGDQLAECGNSGNSTQPHLHIQVMDRLDLGTAKGVPIAFTNFRERVRGSAGFADRDSGMPAERSVVAPREP